jgi:hypothetical protein
MSFWVNLAFPKLNAIGPAPVRCHRPGAGREAVVAEGADDDKSQVFKGLSEGYLRCYISFTVTAIKSGIVAHLKCLVTALFQREEKYVLRFKIHAPRGSLIRAYRPGR